MSTRKWAYKPGELSKRKILRRMSSFQDDMMQRFIDLTDSYAIKHPTKRTMVLNDNLETVFFLQIGFDLTEAQHIDVYVWDGDEYLQVPNNLARKVSETYFEYVDVMSEVYEALGGEN